MKHGKPVIESFTDSQIQPDDVFTLRCIHKVEKLKIAIGVIENIFKYEDIPKKFDCENEIEEILRLIATTVLPEYRVGESDITILRH